MEMLPPAPSVVVGAAVEKRFPGYGTYRGTIEEINGGKALVHWATTDERTTLTLKEAAKRVVEGRRRTNPVVDGQLVPRERKTTKKRRRDEPAATPSPRARRQRRAANYAEDPDFEP